MPKIGQFQRHQIIILHKEGYSQRAIHQKLGISRGGIQHTIKKFEETGQVDDLERNGRPRKLSKSDEHFLKVTSLRNRKKSSKELTQDLKDASGPSVHPCTTRRSLIRSGLKGRVAAKKPFLRKGNRQKRLVYAKNHKNWTENQWQKVLWSDESKFEIFGSNRRQYVRRRAGERYNSECLQPSVKHGGGSVMVWGCISANGVGDLVKIEGIMNAEKYRQLLIHHAVPSGKRLIGNGFIFQHDNDPKHTSNVVKAYLQKKEEAGTLTVLDWPPQSPDLNIIEAVWDHLDRERNKMQPSSKEELWHVLQEAWRNIPADYLKKLQESLPKRVAAVSTNRGGHTKY